MCLEGVPQVCGKRISNEQINASLMCFHIPGQGVLQECVKHICIGIAKLKFELPPDTHFVEFTHLKINQQLTGPFLIIYRAAIKVIILISLSPIRTVTAR